MTLHVGTVGPPIRANSMEPEVLRQMLDALTSQAGVVGPGDLAVAQTGGGASMAVQVGAGFAIVGGTHSPPAQGDYIVYNDAVVTLAIGASTSQPRVDLIELKVQDSYYGVAGDTAAFAVVPGTPAASPSVPAADPDAIVLAHVYVPASASSIVNANINGTTGTNNPDSGGAYTAPLATSLRPMLGLLSAAPVAASGFSGEQVSATLVVPDFGIPVRIKLSALQLADGSVSTDRFAVNVRDTNISGTILATTRGSVGSALVIPPFKYDVATHAAKTFVMTTSRQSGSGTLTTYSNAAAAWLNGEVVPL